MNYFILIHKNTGQYCSCRKCKSDYDFFISRFKTAKSKRFYSCAYDIIVSRGLYLNIKTNSELIRKKAFDVCMFRYNINSNIYKLLLL